MRTLEIVLLEQDWLTAEFKNLLDQAMHPPNPVAIRDENWGRCAALVEINLDELDLNVLTRLLPRMRDVLNEFRAARSEELNLIRQVYESMPDPSLNLENYPLRS